MFSRKISERDFQHGEIWAQITTQVLLYKCLHLQLFWPSGKTTKNWLDAFFFIILQRRFSSWCTCRIAIVKQISISSVADYLHVSDGFKKIIAVPTALPLVELHNSQSLTLNIKIKIQYNRCYYTAFLLFWCWKAAWVLSLGLICMFSSCRTPAGVNGASFSVSYCKDDSQSDIRK